MQPGGRFTAVNVPVRMLIRNAYQLQDAQLIGGPTWITTEKFDINAKAEGNPTSAQLQEMLRALLVERFGLVLHQESRELPVYVLVLARADGKLGPKLKASDVDCSPSRGRGAAAPNLPPGPPPGQPQTSRAMPCGIRMGFGLLSGSGMSMYDFGNALSPMVGRNVVDRTNLTGHYDVELSWTPDQMQGSPAGPGGPGGPGGGGAPTFDPNGPSIFTAVQEQLGLKLDSQKTQLDVTVIDKVTPPTPD
jgi:uncharacterized protein (TIGR03435 family)